MIENRLKILQAKNNRRKRFPLVYRWAKNVTPKIQNAKRSIANHREQIAAINQARARKLNRGNRNNSPLAKLNRMINENKKYAPKIPNMGGFTVARRTHSY